MPASGRSDVPDLNSVLIERRAPTRRRRSAPSAVHAPCPMSCAPISIRPEPSRRSTVALASALRTSAPGTGCRTDMPQPTRTARHHPASGAVPLDGRAQPKRSAPCSNSIRAAPWTKTACRKSARHRHNFLAGTPADPCAQACAASSIALSSAIDAGRLTGRAHEQRRAGVEPDRLVRGGNRRDWRTACARRLAAGSKKSSNVLDGDPGVVARSRSARASPSTADAKPSGGCRRTMTHRPVHMLTAQHQLDRPADHPGRQDTEQSVGP